MRAEHGLWALLTLGSITLSHSAYGEARVFAHMYFLCPYMMESHLTTSYCYPWLCCSHVA